VPSALNLDTYLATVWKNYLGRDALRRTTEIQQAVLDQNGVSESLVVRIERQMEEWTGLATRSSGITPQDLKQPGDFGQEVFDIWFNEDKDDVPGLNLPIAFPLKIRSHEMTLVCGEDGSGKSIFLGQIATVLMKQGWKGMIASFEVRSAITLWMLTRQILGTGPRFVKNDENAKRLAAALAFLHSNLWIYDFLGITDWRLLLDVMRYAREKHKVDFFVVDSVMRIGIAEDDLATQSLAAAEFAGFTVQTGAHVFLVQHLNKSREGGIKNRITSSKRWSDNANNIVEMQRNSQKKEKQEELLNKLKSRQIDQGKYDEEMAMLVPQRDGKFVLAKQRYPGTPQNGSKYLWFDEHSLQFRDSQDDGPVDYLL
jgi:twinkle protein